MLTLQTRVTWVTLRATQLPAATHLCLPWGERSSDGALGSQVGLSPPWPLPAPPWALQSWSLPCPCLCEFVSFSLWPILCHGHCGLSSTSPGASCVLCTASSLPAVVSPFSMGTGVGSVSAIAGRLGPGVDEVLGQALSKCFSS